MTLKKKSAPEEMDHINLLFLFSGKHSPKGLARLFNQLLEDTIGTETAVLELNTHFVTFILGGVWGSKA